MKFDIITTNATQWPHLVLQEHHEPQCLDLKLFNENPKGSTGPLKTSSTLNFVREK